MFRCFYFTVISFSTVGYGDFLVQADQDNRGLNTLGFVVTLYVGISFFSLFLATLQVRFLKVCSVALPPRRPGATIADHAVDIPGGCRNS